MRFTAILLLACIVFLSSFGGIVKPALPHKMDCCKKMARMQCHSKPVKPKMNDGCDEPGCTMMLSCSICGFMTELSLAIQPPYADPMPKPVAHDIPGDPIAYHPDSWKPPRAC